MKEKTRQIMLRSGAGVTRSTAAFLVTEGYTFSGCLSGSGWTGVQIYRNGHPVGKLGRLQNDAPTGWERRGWSAAKEERVEWKIGDRIAVAVKGNKYHHWEAYAKVQSLPHFREGRREWTVV